MIGDYFLLVGSEGQATEVIAEIKIGRAKTNDIVLSDPLTSRHHATVYMQADSLMLRDEKSVNGTLVNGKRIYEPVSLENGDQLQFGDEVFVVRAPLEEMKTLRSSAFKAAEDVHDRTEMVDSGVENVQPQFEVAGLEPVVSDSSSEDQHAAPRENLDHAKTGKRINFIILFVVLAILCICCISILVVAYFVLQDSSLFTDPNISPYQGLSGFIF